uniref:hypothetical protein n=1 Tax=Lactobacillus acidophilus TaxID=1579 RepID=UPI003F571ED8
MLKFIVVGMIMLNLISIVYGLTQVYKEADGLKKVTTVIWIVIFMAIIKWLFGILPVPWS